VTALAARALVARVQAARVQEAKVQEARALEAKVQEARAQEVGVTLATVLAAHLLAELEQAAWVSAAHHYQAEPLQPRNNGGIQPVGLPFLEGSEKGQNKEGSPVALKER